MPGDALKNWTMWFGPLLAAIDDKLAMLPTGSASVSVASAVPAGAARGRSISARSRTKRKSVSVTRVPLSDQVRLQPEDRCIDLRAKRQRVKESLEAGDTSDEEAGYDDHNSNSSADEENCCD